MVDPLHRLDRWPDDNQMLVARSRRKSFATVSTNAQRRPMSFAGCRPLGGRRDSHRPGLRRFPDVLFACQQRPQDALHRASRFCASRIEGSPRRSEWMTALLRSRSSASCEKPRAAAAMASGRRFALKSWYAFFEQQISAGDDVLRARWSHTCPRWSCGDRQSPT